MSLKQLDKVPGSQFLEDGSLVFIDKRPGIFATWVYPLIALLLFFGGQEAVLWLLLAVGLFEHGVRYPRTYDVFYPAYFYINAALVILLPSLWLFLTLATGVRVEPW